MDQKGKQPRKFILKDSSNRAGRSSDHITGLCTHQLRIRTIRGEPCGGEKQRELKTPSSCLDPPFYFPSGRTQLSRTAHLGFWGL
jgi:ribosomal protein L15E